MYQSSIIDTNIVNVSDITNRAIIVESDQLWGNLSKTYGKLATGINISQVGSASPLWFHPEHKQGE